MVGGFEDVHDTVVIIGPSVDFGNLLRLEI